VRLVLGIGNPGSRYQFNRHNVGFMLLDYFADKHSLSFKPSKSDYYCIEGKIEDSNFSLIKPTTYVNNTGFAALDVLNKYRIETTDLLVVCDDVNLNVAAIRVRISGGDGGHNGVSSIIYHLNTNNFPRLRIGIGNDFQHGYLAEYVLTDFPNHELNELEKSFVLAAALIEDFIKGGIKQMLNTNSKLNRSDSHNNLLNQ